MKEHLERANPYLMIGTIVTVLAFTASIWFHSADADQRVALQVSTNTADIQNIKAHDQQQDAAIRQASKRTDEKLDQLDQKISHVLDLMIKERRQQ